ncbi:MAG: aldo/keto reductase [Clostridia bacterium]|nr:aldo/keto reductase [Clostridia bacterium]
MRKKRLGKTNYYLSEIGLGTVQFGLDYGFNKKLDQDSVNEILSCAKKQGINFIDTASSYGDSEEKIGNYVSQNDNDFIIATKLAKISPQDVENKESIKNIIYSSVELSLSNLKLDKLNLLQLHQADSYITNSEYFWHAISNLKSENLIDSFGISVYETKETIKLVNEYRQYIDFFQIPYNVFDRRFDDLVDTFKEFKIGIISRSAFLKGVITCREDSLPKELFQLGEYKNKLNTLAKELELGVDELVLQFVNSKDFISTTILGINSVSELQRNIDIIQGSKINNQLHELEQLKVTDIALIDPRNWTSL